MAKSTAHARACVPRQKVEHDGKQKKFTYRKTENEDSTSSSLTIDIETLTAGPPMSAHCFKSIYESWLLRHILIVSRDRWGDRGLKKHLNPVHDQVASKRLILWSDIRFSADWRFTGMPTEVYDVGNFIWMYIYHLFCYPFNFFLNKFYIPKQQTGISSKSSLY